MVLLLQIMLFYSVLALVVMTVVWLGIGRSGFMGLQQADSRVAMFFLKKKPTMLALSEKDLTRTNVVLMNASPAFATSAVMVLMVAQFCVETGPRSTLTSAVRATGTSVTIDANADL